MNRPGCVSRLLAHPARLLVVGFAATILIGGTLLALPVATWDGRSIGVIDALFMATSAVCVTAMSTISITTIGSMMGQSG